MIELLILDVDGVLTDGKKYYDNTGTAKYKTFCDKDFSAIKKFKASNCKVIFLSGDRNINESIARNRSVDFFYASGKCKSTFLDLFKNKYNVSLENMAYIGDDIFDLEIMKKVKYSFCPLDAVRDIKSYCGELNTLNVNGGDNCIDKFYDLCVDRNIIKSYNLTKFLNLDKYDKF
tara:strand:- start:2977 stop:3501 length:525 start_codon:yes stop_codon:yes gene_type:complete